MNNSLSFCGLIDATIRASDKDLPVPRHYWNDLNRTKLQKGTVCVCGPLPLCGFAVDGRAFRAFRTDEGYCSHSLQKKKNIRMPGIIPHNSCYAFNAM
mgnify:CR=1 FL=1